MNIERALLWNSLCNMGKLSKLKLNFNPHETLDRLKQFDNNWCPYNVKKDTVNNRWGLPVTSHSRDVMDNYHLNSFGYMQRYHDIEMKEENFVTPTEVYKQIPEIANLVDMFAPDIGRVHILRVDKGGFFPPHRDFPSPDPEYFRLFGVFGKCKPENYTFLLDGQPVYPEAGHMYFCNFQLDHSVFSFSDSVYNLILTVKITQRTYDLIVKQFVSE